MKTKKQEELVNSYLSQLNEALRPVYYEIILYLSELGYNPKKEKSSITFKHDLHNKQMAKIGFRRNKEHTPFLALRFSACRGYSKRFDDIVRAAVLKYPTRAARCTHGGCDFCQGEPQTHAYTCTFPDGEIRYQCGANAMEIPDITAADVEEIKKLIKEEHRYLMKHEAGVEVA